MEDHETEFNTNESIEFAPKGEMKSHFTTVTPFSKYLAMVLFIIFPFIGFCIGVQFTNEMTEISIMNPIKHTENLTENSNTVIDLTTEEVLKTTNESKIDTSNWVKYNNDKYGFSFLYPTSLKLIKNTLGTNDGVILNTTGSLSYSNKYPRFQVSFDDTSTHSGVGEIVSINGYLFERYTFGPFLNASVNTRGFELRRSPVLSKSTAFKTLYIKATTLADDPSLLPIFEKILDTFEYVASTETPNFKLYRSEDLGFEIKIPQDFDEISEIQGDSVSFSRGDYCWRCYGFVSVSSNINNISLEDIRNNGPEDFMYYSKGFLNVDGYKALKGQSTEGGVLFVIVIFDDKIYRLSQGLTQDEILSTFKFLKI